MATDESATECLVNDRGVTLMLFGSGVSACVFVCVCVCVCVCMWKAGAPEGHALSCNVLDDYASVWSMCVD